MKIVLPYPPSVNTYWRSVVIKGRVVVLLSANARVYRKDCLARVLKEHGVLRPSTERCRVVITVHPPDHRRRDLDNTLKGVLDALRYCRVIEDDSLIDVLTVLRGHVSKDSPRVEVQVTEILSPIEVQ